MIYKRNPLVKNVMSHPCDYYLIYWIILSNWQKINTDKKLQKAKQRKFSLLSDNTARNWIKIAVGPHKVTKLIFPLDHQCMRQCVTWKSSSEDKIINSTQPHYLQGASKKWLTTHIQKQKKNNIDQSWPYSNLFSFVCDCHRRVGLGLPWIVVIIVATVSPWR